MILKTDVRHGGTVSNLAEIGPVPAPEAPIDVKTETREGVVRISWTMPADPAPKAVETDDAASADEAPTPPAAPRVNVYRAVAGDSIPVEPVDGSPFSSTQYEDEDVTPGVTHRYVLRSVVTADGGSVESDPTSEIIVTYADKYAPAIPRGLRLIPEGRRVNLVWNPSEERDLDGYHVYRRVAGGAWERIDVAPIPTATFTDQDPPAGPEVEYAVTAFDESTPPNESEKSQPVRVSVHAGGGP